MNANELLELAASDPDNAFTVLKGHGFSNLPVDELPKGMIQDDFGLEEKQLKTVEFIFWISYFLERKIGEMIAKAEEQKVESKDHIIGLLLDKLSFGAKIEVVEKLYLSDKKYKSFIKILRKVEVLRNHVAHGRLNKLEYDGHKLGDSDAKWKLVFEIRNASMI